VTRPSWQLPVASHGKCWNTTPTFAWILSGKALDGLATRRSNSQGKPVSYDTNYDTTPASNGIESNVTYRKEWSGREDSNVLTTISC
jgi:hypothetical protein